MILDNLSLDLDKVVVFKFLRSLDSEDCVQFNGSILEFLKFC